MSQHKLAATTIVVQTQLSPRPSAELVQLAATLTHGKPSLNVLEPTGICVTAVQLPHVGLAVYAPRTNYQMLKFTATISDQPYGSLIEVALREYRTDQLAYGFVPVSAKSLTGYKTYKQYLECLASTIVAEDPNARCYLTEKGHQQLLEPAPIQHHNAAAASPAAGWYPDPYGGVYQRYWDGGTWSEHTHPY